MSYTAKNIPEPAWSVLRYLEALNKIYFIKTEIMPELDMLKEELDKVLSDPETWKEGKKLRGLNVEYRDLLRPFTI